MSQSFYFIVFSFIKSFNKLITKNISISIIL